MMYSAKPRPSLEAQLLTTVSIPPEIETAWEELGAARGNAFVTPQWYRAALRYLERDVEPATVAVQTRSGQLVGVLPLVRTVAGVLRFAGSTLGDCFHPAARAEDEILVAEVAARALGATRWRLARFDRAPEGARWPSAFATASGRRLVLARDDPMPMPFLEIKGRTWDEYVRHLPGEVRQLLRRKNRALERDSHVSVHRAVSGPAVERAVETLLDLHARRWHGEGTAFTSPDGRRFLRAFALSAADAGWLRLWELRVDGTAVAAWLGWHLGSRYAYYQAGYDPARRRQSIGTILLARTIRAAFEEAASEYDFLLGGEAYKYQYANRERWVRTVVLVPAFSPARARIVAEIAARRLGRRLPPDARRVAQHLRRAARQS